jgi:hypothetical protein
MKEKKSAFEGGLDENVDKEQGLIDMGPDTGDAEEIDPVTGLPLAEVSAAGLRAVEDGEQEEE